jgi:hypothetical protein
MPQSILAQLKCHHQYQPISIAPRVFATPSQPICSHRIRSKHRAPAPPIVDTDISLSQLGTQPKRAALSEKREKKNPVTESDTVSQKGPITTVAGINDDGEDGKDAKLKVSTMGMDKVEVDRKNDNEAKITVDGVNDDDEDVKDAKSKVSTMGMDKVKIDRKNNN